MTRGSYVFRDGKFIPKAEATPIKKQFHSVITDELDPIEHPATGQIITSKRKFRKITREHGLEECYGVDDKYWEKEAVDDEALIRADVEKSMAQLRYGEGITDEERDICQIMDKREEWESN